MELDSILDIIGSFITIITGLFGAWIAWLARNRTPKTHKGIYAYEKLGMASILMPIGRNAGTDLEGSYAHHEAKAEITTVRVQKTYTISYQARSMHKIPCSAVNLAVDRWAWCWC